MNSLIFQVLFYWYRLLHPRVQTSARLPLAQALLESASFTSHLYQTNNNFMGMNIPVSRHTTATNVGGTGFAKFDSAADCVADYLMFLDDMELRDDAALETYLKTKYAKNGAQYWARVSAIEAELQAGGKYVDSKLILAGTVTTAGVLAAGVVVGAQHLLDS